MNKILDQIVRTKIKEVEQLKERYTFKNFEEMPGFGLPKRSLKKALEGSSFGVIAEIKRKSPSAGVIKNCIVYSEMAKEYETCGATAISCLTDRNYFGGSFEDLEQARMAVDLPVLRKDFIIDEYQLLETKAMGADVVLLISEILSREQIIQFSVMAQSLGLEVLLEFHGKDQLNKLTDLVDVIGVNNRNLQIQKTD